MKAGAAGDAGAGDERRGRPRRSRFGLSGHPVESGDSVSLFYKGPSMTPLLNSPDILYVRPYGRRKVRCGDVVVFGSPDADGKVVHRVVSVDGKGVRTKGDNNSHVDSWILMPEDIIGWVEWIEKTGRRVRIFGGRAGQAQAGVLKALRLFDAGLCAVFRPLYGRLARSRALKGWLVGRSLTRVISISRPEGIELHLLLGGRVIGRRPAGRRCWQIRRPFPLFVDEKSLPSGD